MKFTYDIDQLLPYVNWVYFYHAWQVKDEGEQNKLRSEAEDFLTTIQHRRLVYALFTLEKAHADGDDIVVERTGGNVCLPCLRQQQAGSDCLCLADYIGLSDDRVGLFATSTDASMVDSCGDDPYQRMMAQLLADRLAEAAAERLHQEVRRTLWGYAHDETVSIGDMLQGRYQGIRPAVGYPSLPDTGLNFVLDRLLHLQQIGIALTESGAMRPHASVTGLMISHPQARYFAVGKIGNDQLLDYARRRQMPLETIKKFLSANL